ncbi:MAG TPA: hypothetical protein PLJ71_15965 [Candidatus Hydrogenedentes bacterium]|mgnify:FL=1|nr:hypothetical protein [Candidatus Hydrogenedentota bacterium]HQM50184.1 hypothetical protein [Candidatus Hydrogenedentota bacterium]
MGLRWRWCLLTGALLSGFVQPSNAFAAPSTVESIREGVWVVRDESGNWGGSTMGITHQRGPHYWAKKVLDLSAVPEDVWAGASEVRLSAYFCVRDYSWRELPAANGLDEAFEIVVNDVAHRIPTNSGLPVYDEKLPMGEFMRWHDFPLPKEAFVRGENTILFRMTAPEGKKPDDYLYLGIDNTAAGGNSWVRFGEGQEWRQDQLTVPGGAGEYMVRLYLLSGSRTLQAVWLPGEQRTDGTRGLIAYAGSHGADTRVEWAPLRIDPLEPVTVVIETTQESGFAASWLDESGAVKEPSLTSQGARLEAALSPPLPFRPSGIRLDKSVPVSSVTITASESYHPQPERVDMTPAIAPPAGGAAARAASCRIDATGALLENDSLSCRFELADGRLRLVSLYNEWAAAEMVRAPGDSALFLVEIESARLAGSRDFVCTALPPMTDRQGFTATLVHEPSGLSAALSVWVDTELRMGLTFSNVSDHAAVFKAAFPHLSGLAISEDPAGDYYFFPWGGGIFSGAPALIRRGYGDHAALYQLMDLYSPARGAGLAIRSTDADGRHKVLALRKHIPGKAEMNGDAANTPTSDEYKWTANLPQTPGTGFAFEYLRRTRQPGESFVLKDAALSAHPGDWRGPMKSYAEWCHQVWAFRALSSLRGVVNMIAAGWGQSPLFRDGAYRTDFIQPRCDCIELMSWWEWSELGPWRTPWDQLEARLGEATYNRYRPYFVEDPVTGKTMYPINRGDYDGYNQRWGGLPAFQEAVKAYRGMGPLVTLYTDPILACDNSRCGQQWGKLWGIVQPNGEYSTNYESWNMCHEVAEYRQYVADTMRRVMQETDADGIRLDEYGHGGAACFSTLHKHTFAEPGCTEWLRCIAETTRMVRRAMDEVKPGSVLTTEHPGYDYLMQCMEGCITYDLTVQATPLRPLECNLQRFFFPECKAFELDHRGADPDHHKRLWNGVASFGAYYPEDMDAVLRENIDVFEGAPCEPLAPTLARHIYANRFGAGPKTIHTLYNATGMSFFGPVLALDLASDEHLFDLLHGRELEPVADGRGAVVDVFLERGGVTCIARFPKRISVQSDGADIVVSVAGDVPEGARVAVCDARGLRLAEAPIVESTAGFVRAELPMDRPAVCIKLMNGGVLVDAVAVPSSKSGIL